ncbi:unnamed protein product [Rotaria sp. Silwood1]|nr:unnamed protein product [Rotaria sp. Silwood1]
MMTALRDFFDYVNGLGVGSMIESLQESGFESLLSDDALDFLDNDNLTINERVEKFFERRVRRPSPEEITTLASEIVVNIRQVFEPLKEKLVPIQTANTLTFGAVDTIGQIGDIATVPIQLFSRFILRDSESDSIRKYPRLLCRGKPEWFTNTANYLTNFVMRHGVSDHQLEGFLRVEGLEDDFQHFQSCINQWTRQVREMLPLDQDFIIGKSVAMTELERMRKFLYAVVLNKPELLQEHNNATRQVIHDAAAQERPTNYTSLLPCISYGQLLLPTGERRIIDFTFVLVSTNRHGTAERILDDISNMFKNVKSKKVEMNDGIQMIKLKVEIDENVPHLIAKIISKLANLIVRSILIGNFGINGFRHAMNPAYNRIYSYQERETAEGFIPTWFSTSLDRGGEPYYCPVGWRRYAIDVGMTGAQFEKEYGRWAIAYHGTAGTLAMAILLNGLRASGHGCFLKKNQSAVYLSPSIEYSGHPRYAKVLQIKSKYVQMVLQVRIDPLLIEKHQGTLYGAIPYDTERADLHFSNNELEWIIRWKSGENIKALNGILVYGLMFRVTDEDPQNLPQNRWWNHKCHRC